MCPVSPSTPPVPPANSSPTNGPDPYSIPNPPSAGRRCWAVSFLSLATRTSARPSSIQPVFISESSCSQPRTGRARFCFHQVWLQSLLSFERPDFTRCQSPRPSGKSSPNEVSLKRKFRNFVLESSQVLGPGKLHAQEEVSPFTL